MDQQLVHWVKELEQMKKAAIDHLDTFDMAKGVNTSMLNEAKDEIRSAYTRAQLAVCHQGT